MKKLSRILAALLMVCMILSMLPTVFAADETVDFAFLVTSDLHGQIYATDYTVDQTKSGTHIQGLTRLATYIKSQRVAYGDNLFVADLGDTIQGAPLTYYYAFNKLEEQQPAMKAFRTIGYDMWVVGNHEFNYGLKILNKQLTDITAPATADETPVNVCMANYLKAETNSDKAKDWNTWNGYKPYVIKDFDGVKVAVIGFGNPNIAKWDIPANWEGIYFADILETYKHYEKEMQEKADMIVVMTHSGLDSEMDNQWDSVTRLVSQTNSISMVFSGHEHNDKVKPVKNADGKEISVLQPGTKAAAIAQVAVTYNKTTKEVTLTPEVKPAITRDENNKKVACKGFEIDTALAAKLLPYETETWDKYMNIKIGEAAADFSAADLGTKPSAFMDLINTVQLWGAYDNTGKNTPKDDKDDKPAMLSISAPLTVGDNPNIIPAGDIKLGDLFKLYRFENWFYQITMTGEEVHQWLEFAATKIQLDKEGKPYVSSRDLTYYDVIYGEGFTYTIDYTSPIGKRIVEMTYNGKKVEKTDKFTVVVNNYRYNGGGNYVMWLNNHGCDFKANDPGRIIYSTQFDMIQGEDKGQARTLLMDYIQKEKVITPTVTSTWKTVDNNSDITEIFFTNDVHGAYENYSYAAELMKYGDIIVDAGDSIQGSVATTLTNGQCMVDLMKAVGYDVAVPGNHEFDYGFDRFLEIVKGAGNTPYVSANLWDKTADKAVLDAYKIIEANGKKFAIVGITTPETLVKSTPTFFQNDKGVYIYDFCNDTTGEKLYTVVQAAVDAAKKEGADYVIAVGHLGIDEQSKPWTSTSVIANTTGIDALIDGHSHSTFTTTQKNKDGKDVVVAQTGTKLKNVGRLVIGKDGKISAELLPVTADSFGGKVAETVKKIKEEVDLVSKKVVAKTDVDLTTKDPVTGERAVRSAETNLGDLCADAYRDLLGTDIAFVNGGGVRADIEKGDITYGQIIAVHPFGNTACKIEVTGEQIWTALEIGSAANPGESGGFLQVSGLEYTINTAIPTPARFNENKEFVKLEGKHRVTDVKIGGEPLDVNKTYTLGGHNYMLLQCGDGYTVFKGSKVLAQEVAIDNEVLIKYITDTLKGVVAADSIYANPTGAGRIHIVNDVELPFTDVKETDWFYEEVKEVYALGVVNGMTLTTFEPETNVTRAHFITMLYRLDGEKKVEDGTNSFTDLQKGAYYIDAINWGVKHGITNGISATEFAPDEDITREQIATMLFRYATYAQKAGLDQKIDLATKFEDAAKVSDYAKAALEWAAALEIVKGDENGIRPLDDATRAEAAALIVRIHAVAAK
mgnify:CR=1 FL=1